MGLGGTAKKLQKVVDAAEQLYSKMNEVIERLTKLEKDVENTSTQVDHLERDIAEQRALIEALAEQEGLDVEDILEQADLPPEPTAGDESEGSTDGDADSTAVDVTEET